MSNEVDSALSPKERRFETAGQQNDAAPPRDNEPAIANRRSLMLSDKRPVKPRAM